MELRLCAVENDASVIEQFYQEAVMNGDTVSKEFSEGKIFKINLA